MPGDGQVTLLLQAVRDGDDAALGTLFTLLYRELREIAHRQLGGGTLGTTAVVHEAYLKLLGSEGLSAQDRGHFFALASRVMRQILVDRARAQRAQKRGGGAAHLPLDELLAAAPDADASAAALLDLDAALVRLEALDPRLSRLIELRFFGGFEMEEAATILGVTARTLRRDWRKARAFLYAELYAEGGGEVAP
ncbi:MAG: sigma-70 family RNA polymerase sigma factor [Candidatus Latescibacteria bacterium]|nr:sigma-70 family RNA polymerase sigma factor [Candidatus Latescibacterota bacterium]